MFSKNTVNYGNFSDSISKVGILSFSKSATYRHILRVPGFALLPVEVATKRWCILWQNGYKIQKGTYMNSSVITHSYVNQYKHDIKSVETINVSATIEPRDVLRDLMNKTRPSPDWLTIEECCTFLGISHPTFNKRREEFRLKARHWQGRLWFSRRQLADRITLQAPLKTSSQVNLIEAGQSRVSQIKRKGNVYDLRSLLSIDSFGVICLLCTLLSEKEKSSVTIDESNVARLLSSIGFFSELAQQRGESVNLIRPPYTGSWIDPSIMQQLVSVKLKGGERLAVAELQKSLSSQGFSSELGNYAGWVIGELADNALTHGKSTCYTVVQRIDREARKIAISIGDTGLGIPATLKLNRKYANLSAKEAFLTAFRPYVSGWGDEFKRGKGLTDIVKIVAGNRGYMHVETGALALRMDFRTGADIQFISPVTRCPGTRYLIELEDHAFQEISRPAADHFIVEAMQRLFDKEVQS